MGDSKSGPLAVIGRVRLPRHRAHGSEVEGDERFPSGPTVEVDVGGGANQQAVVEVDGRAVDQPVLGIVVSQARHLAADRRVARPRLVRQGGTQAADAPIAVPPIDVLVDLGDAGLPRSSPMPEDRGDEAGHVLPVVAGRDVRAERIDPVAAEDQQGAVVARACRGNEAEGGDALRERECPASGEVVGLGEDQLRAGRRGPDVPRFECGVVDRHPQPPVAVGHLLAPWHLQRPSLPRRGAVVDDGGVQEILNNQALDRLAHPDAQGG